MRRFQARGSSSHDPSPVVLTCLLLLSGYTPCQVLFAIQPFFHCSKYIRTRIPGLTAPVSLSSQQLEFRQEILQSSEQGLSEKLCRFLAQQVVCFLCTVNREGRCAVNHRGGAAGFLLSFLPHEIASGGVVLLPDYTGNGAFEAVGNILETEQAALVVPHYAAQLALCLSGSAYVVEPEALHVEVARRCVAAERIVALAVQRVEVQSGDWSTTLAYECARAGSLWAETPNGLSVSSQVRFPTCFSATQAL